MANTILNFHFDCPHTSLRQREIQEDTKTENIFPILVSSKELRVLVLVPAIERKEDKERYKERDKPKYKEKENILPILVPSKEVCVLVLSPDKGRV